MKNRQVEVKKVEGNGHKTNWLQILKNHFTDLKGAGWTNENLTTIDGLVDNLVTAIGAIEGATTLHNKLTVVRAGYLDELDFDLQGLLNTIAAYLTTEIADILADTGTDGVVINSLTGAAETAIEAEVEDALQAKDLDRLINVALGAALDTFIIDDSILGFLLAKSDVSTFDRTTDSMEAISEAIDAIIGVDTLQEQIPDTDFSLAAIDTTLTADPPAADAENSVVDIDANAGDSFALRSLIVNITSFGTGAKLVFSLWVPVNGTITEVDSVDVSSLGFQNLMDLFGLQEIHGDSIHITVVVDVGTTGACEGTWKYAKAS